MSVETRTVSASNSNRYDAVLRMTEALSTCREPEKLATTLAEQISKFLHFEHLYLLVLKKKSKEIEYLVWGKGPMPLPDLPMEEVPSWATMDSQDVLHTPDWDAEDRFPRFKEWAKRMGLGSGIRVPLTTPHHRLGVFGINRDTVNPFSEDDIDFLRLIGRVVALAIDDALNLRCAQRQNDRLQLLLNLTNRITSNLRPRDLLRAIAASVREVMHCDVVAVSLLVPTSGKSRLYALDFPQGKGFLREDRVQTLSAPSKRVLETLQPAIVDRFDPADFSPEVYDRVVGEGLKSSCLIPLVTRGRAVGLLTIARTTEPSFTPDDVQFLTQAAGQIAIAIENALAYHEISELKDKLTQEKLYLEEEIRSEMNFENIVGNSPALKHVLELVETVAPSDSTVLLLARQAQARS
jgi:formate hydrogenlyase transcriptional activator